MKLVFSILPLIFFLSQPAISNNQQCKVTFPPILQEGYTYTGECVNGLAHGKGTVKLTNGIAYKYTGQFKNGRFNGQGESVIDDIKHRGNFLNGLLYGSCQIEMPAISTTYTGQCVAGNMQGYGKLVLGGRVTTTYEGQWHNNKLNGYGTQKTSDSRTYEIYQSYQGQFSNGTRHGKGTLTLINGKRYSGVWENGKAVSGDIMKLSKPSPPANSAPIRSSHQGTEASKCYAIAWDHPNNGGLGLHRGGAIELCKGTKNAIETTECFRHAWDHPNNGGLGLHRGGAIDLCKASQF